MKNTLQEFLEALIPGVKLGGFLPRSNYPNKVIWHHANGTAASPCTPTRHHTVDIIDTAHKSRWPGFTSRVFKDRWGNFFHCGYHRVLDFEKRLKTATRGFYEEAAACIGMNRSAVQVLMIGNYDRCSGEEITKRDEEMIYQQWKEIKEEFPHLTIADNVPHRKYASKSCFGNSLSDNYIQQAIRRQMSESEATENDEHAKQVETLRKLLIELLQRYIAMLTQQLSGRRLSLRE